MDNWIEKARQVFRDDSFTHAELMNLLSGTPSRRYNLIKRAIAKKDIIPLRRERYLFAKKYRRYPLNLFSIAQKIYMPSYVSFESALSYHGWIPESVPIVSSATFKRTKRFENEMGLFEYTHVRCVPFWSAVSQVTEEGGVFFVAHPWKAIADYIDINKKDWVGIGPLIDSLRIEKRLLEKESRRDFNEIIASYPSEKSKRVVHFFNALKKELK